MDAFDADVLIYAGVADHELGRRTRALFPIEPLDDVQVRAGCGSVLLLPELLTKPMRNGSTSAVAELAALLGRLDLLRNDLAAAELGAAYGLHAADAVHLAPQ